MKLFLILVGSFVLVAGFSVDSGENLHGEQDGYWNRYNADRRSFGSGMFDYFTKNRMSSDYANKKNIDTDRLVNQNPMTDRMVTGESGMGRDLKYTIMNDKDILRKQKFILDMFRNVYSNIIPDKIKDLHFVEGESYYTSYDRVIPFLRLYRSNTLLPRGHTFTISDRVHKEQVVALFNLFYYSKDFDVFHKNVLWARFYVNEDMFVYVLTAAIFHRTDLLGIKIPSHYEIAPHKYHTGLTLSRAINMMLGDTKNNVLIVKNYYTNDISVMNEDSKLAYLTEDVAWNQFHFYLHMGFPVWLAIEDVPLYRKYSGEILLYQIQQLVARYYLERLSNGLGPIKDISFDKPIKTGYDSSLSHFNGHGYSVRKNYYDVYSTEDYFLISRIYDFERRIREAIDRGYVMDKTGGKVDLYADNGFDILGKIIQANKDSPNDRFYQSPIALMRKLLGGGYTKNIDHWNVHPSVMEDFETAMRDPVTYQLYKRILKLVHLYKNNRQPYTTKDLLVKGVRVLDMQTSKLVTYFDNFDVDISNIFERGIRSLEEFKDNSLGDNVVLARHTRLNHKPFTVNIDVASEQAEKVVVRLFFGPKYDHTGKIMRLEENRENFISIDKFIYDLPAGRTTIKRSSQDFSYVAHDRTTYLDLYKNILMTKDLSKLLELNIVESHCGYPKRLTFPRGWVGGMPMQLFVIITRAANNKNQGFLTGCGYDSRWFHVDNFKLGFPFDRRIDEGEFFTTNMLFKDIFIYHEGVDTNAKMERGFDSMRENIGQFDSNRMMQPDHI